MSSEENGPILRDTDDPSNDNELDVQIDCCSRLTLCDPRSKFHRFLALILMCLLGFGECFDLNVNSKSILTTIYIRTTDCTNLLNDFLFILYIISELPIIS